MLLLVFSLILFFATHSLRIVAPGFRANLISSMGARTWHIGYGIVAILTFVLLVYAFGQARQVTGMLYSPPVWTAHLALTLMLFAMICLVAGVLPAGYIKTKGKYPFILAIKIWALSHLLANGETSSVLLFAAFLAWGVFLRISLKRRERAGEITRKPFVSGRYDLMAIAGGIVLWVAFIWKLHEWLIGVQPIAM
jgi:uncharacterized membrane protein